MKYRKVQRVFGKFESAIKQTSTLFANWLEKEVCGAYNE